MTTETRSVWDVASERMPPDTRMPQRAGALQALQNLGINPDMSHAALEAAVRAVAGEAGE